MWASSFYSFFFQSLLQRHKLQQVLGIWAGEKKQTHTLRKKGSLDLPLSFSPISLSLLFSLSLSLSLSFSLSHTLFEHPRRFQCVVFRKVNHQPLLLHAPDARIGQSIRDAIATHVHRQAC